MHTFTVWLNDQRLSIPYTTCSINLLIKLKIAHYIDARIYIYKTRL